MKKFLIFLLAASFLSLGLYVPATSAEEAAAPGKVIKGKGNSTVYYVGEDNKRYVFPNDKIYFSWYEDFSEVQEISLDDLQAMPLGGNVHYKPGALLVKIQTDPKVYAVSNNGTLRWVKTEAMAKALYGAHWNKLVDDVPDSFFTNYTVGTAIESDEDYDPADESDSFATFSHSKGWKERVKERIESNYATKQCQHLERAVNQLQKRLARWDMAMPDLGDDFLDTCISKVKGNKFGQDKIAICHIPDDGGDPKTIHVAKPAARAHLDHGDYLGECSDESGDDTKDETAPVISDISVEPKGTSASVEWTTDEDSSSKVEYSTEHLASSSEIKTAENLDMVKSHSLSLTGLSTSTVYYYRVSSTDAAGNENVSSEGTFTTLSADPDEAAPVISEIQADASTTSAVITWKTDEPATSKVVYADSALDGSTTKQTVSDADLSTSHSLILTGLATSTKYYYQVESADFSGNNAASGENDFTTL